MSQSSNFRLVRCPNCNNLLPELADYSVYLCGGCATVLQAKKNNFEADTSSLNYIDDVKENPRLNLEKNTSEALGSVNQNEAGELLRKLDELLRRNHENSSKDSFDYSRFDPFYNNNCCVRRRQPSALNRFTHYPHPRNFNNNQMSSRLSQPRFFHYSVPTIAFPLIGGAPFVSCRNCRELLQVPNSAFLTDKNGRKMKCWGCSTILLLRVVEKKLNVSVFEESSHDEIYGSLNNSEGFDDWDWDEQKTTHKEKTTSLAGKIKNTLKEFSRTMKLTDQIGSINVTVNGHPITDGLVKKAEKIAGLIQPGNYWYDIKAGFWGMINGPCLGIIPPFIEELNYPIEENCAGGNSEVFVNGRELHQKDLEILAMRGLPTVRGRSYRVEISGRIWDDESGQELDSLGKLAPTVEMAKHGFGMKPPKLRV
ncbi:uncharacterized protein LOC124921588 [Impatiens glandulifera]|uniref:uncharacterized protein LOC124921588 n=1 Tax=Impatiens glandulifera TaxID=253017 RepID=UPI001FB07B93|nr:uncharacterized protein LOC124921588 [Impatiens glandulifera]